MTEAEERELLDNTRLLLAYLRPHHVVAQALLPALPIGVIFSTADVIERALNLDPPLYAVLESELGFDETINTRLGKVFGAIAGSPIAGRRLCKSKKTDHGAALWYVEVIEITYP